jgi:dynein heavy chain, axonemal
MIDNHAKQGFISIVLNFSAQTDSLSTQYNIEGKLEKKRKKSRGAKGTLKTLIFVDDINMPMVEEHGAQPPIELLRQLIEKGGFYDRQ